MRATDDIPQAYRVIPTATCKRSTVRTEGDRGNPFPMPGECHFMRLPTIPDLHLSIAMSTSTCEEASIWTERNSGDSSPGGTTSCEPFEDCFEVSLFNIPEPYMPSTSARKRFPIGTERNTGDPVIHSRANERGFVSSIGNIPQMHDAPPAYACERAAIRCECNIPSIR